MNNLSILSKEVLAQEHEGDGLPKGVDMDEDDDHDANKSSSGQPDGSSTNNDSTTDAHSSRTGATDDEMQNIKAALTQKESTQVFRLRVIVILILIAAATSISVSVYYIMRTGQLEQFETEFYATADKIIDRLQDVMIEISAVSGLAVVATADAEENGRKWPFVALNAFQQKANNARLLSGTIFLSINPIVQAENLTQWEDFVLGDASSWIGRGMASQESLGLNGFVDPEQVKRSWLTDSVVDPIHTFDDAGVPRLSNSSGPFLPRWKTSPVLQTSMVNENLYEKHAVSDILKYCVDSESAVLGGFHLAPPGNISSPNPTTAFFATLRSMWEGTQVEHIGDPMSHLAIPIFDRLDGNNREVVGVLKATIHWRWYLRNILPETDYGITVVVENECDGSFTYQLDGPEARVIGVGDRHDTKFSKYRVDGRFLVDTLEDGTNDGIPLNQNSCPYHFHVYPSQEDYDHYVTNEPIVITLSVAAVFLFTIAMFLCYDRLVERRQRVVLARATQSTAIVSSLFPKQVRDRLLKLDTEKKYLRRGDTMLAGNRKLKSFLDGGSEQAVIGDEQPIADFFPNCTVLFCDIAGFTAWSSMREPAQVFILLQTVYQSFDLIAKRRRVFKVETIGDSYLAVTGLPEPQSNHATIMAKFAWDCLMRLADLLKDLEVSLGPDTGELSMRFGIHSGSVTAGVLKGDRARFQLFGDTVNTAARMESTGIKGRIQVSESTAQILKQAGKSSWLTKRADTVSAKGKGVLNTYWLALKGHSPSVGTGASSEDDVAGSFLSKTPKKSYQRQSAGERAAALKEARLVGWVTEILSEHIKKVVIVHQRCNIVQAQESASNDNLHFALPDGQICLDEVQEVICMPKFNRNVAEAAFDWHLVEIPREITQMLHDFVTLIARSYRANPFHNFEHACHVTMSVSKLLKRIVTPDLASNGSPTSADIKALNEMAAKIHDFTNGLTSDPLAPFAIVFSALIHDVDHQGVSNSQLVKEEPEMGKLYQNKSVAEQNSLDVAWDLLMSDQFTDLRKYIFGTRAELLRFRQLIVNMVLATDIFDKELGQLRKDRWQRAFHGDGSLPNALVSDLRATIVMEHIIQASDVSHTMQHWHVYQKWNGKLFAEMYQAFKDNRLGSNPIEFWYQGELGFFDNYIIPLAKKLKDCGVFGVSSDEYLGYALRNRAEWEERGKGIVKTMLERIDASERTTATLEESDESDGK